MKLITEKYENYIITIEDEERDPLEAGYVNISVAKDDQKFFSGSIRFDGCSNWHFNGNNCLHFCGKEDAVKLGNLMELLYKIADKYVVID